MERGRSEPSVAQAMEVSRRFSQPGLDHENGARRGQQLVRRGGDHRSSPAEALLGIGGFAHDLADHVRGDHQIEGPGRRRQGEDLGALRDEIEPQWPELDCDRYTLGEALQ